jgi:peptidoglycan-N-acetylglucosamine deacetylase
VDGNQPPSDRFLGHDKADLMFRWLASLLTTLALAVCAVGAGPAHAAETCADPSHALGVERIVEIDASAGPLYGEISVLAREDSFLHPREVVLTFDDGPMPWITKSILDTLDRFCTKATFFSVGSMAIAYPDSVKDVLARGHTLGGHTWSHPLNLKHRSFDRAIDEIERGFTAIAVAAGQPIAPFFRFPGLSDSDPMLAHLQSRGIAAFTVDVVSNDSYIGNADRLATYTLAQIDKRQGGIILFHDIKSATAKALPVILAGLKQRGYKVVHMRAKAPLVPLDTYEPEMEKLLAKAHPKPAERAAVIAASGTPVPMVPDGGAAPHLLPFFGSPAVLKTLAGQDAEVTPISPPARIRAAATSRDHTEKTVARERKGERIRAGQKPKETRTKRASAEPPSPMMMYGF